MPNPKDPIKLAEYRALLSRIAKERGYGKWMKGRRLPQVVKDKMSQSLSKTFNTPEMKLKMSEVAKKAGNGKWMKGRAETPFLQAGQRAVQKRKGKKYSEIYGSQATVETLKRTLSNQKRWIGVPRKEDRPYQGQTAQYKNWRTAVFTRDNFTCQVCLKRGGQLEAHHIKSWAKFPELRYVVSNGKTTCKDPCHKILNKEQRQNEM